VRRRGTASHLPWQTYSRGRRHSLLLAVTRSPRGTTWRGALENRPYPIAGRGRVGGGVHATAPRQQERTNQQHTPYPHFLTPFPGHRRHVVRASPTNAVSIIGVMSEIKLSRAFPPREGRNGARNRALRDAALTVLRGRFERPPAMPPPKPDSSSARARSAALSAFPQLLPAACYKSILPHDRHHLRMSDSAARTRSF
jgi:hypothetical protein